MEQVEDKSSDSMKAEEEQKEEQKSSKNGRKDSISKTRESWISYYEIAMDVANEPFPFDLTETRLSEMTEMKQFVKAQSGPEEEFVCPRWMTSDHTQQFMKNKGKGGSLSFLRSGSGICLESIPEEPKVEERTSGQEDLRQDEDNDGEAVASGSGVAPLKETSEEK